MILFLSDVESRNYGLIYYRLVSRSTILPYHFEVGCADPVAQCASQEGYSSHFFCVCHCLSACHILILKA